MIIAAEIVKLLTVSELKKRLWWSYSNTHNSKSTWNIGVKFFTVPTDMFASIPLNFYAV